MSAQPLETTHYHKVLRVSLVVMAFVLLFDSGLVVPSSKNLSDSTMTYLSAAVGMSASVAPTELNQLTAELTAQKRELAQREEAIREREIEIGISAATVGQQNDDYSTYVLSSILFILLVLIVLNYTLDYLRAREEQEVLQSA